MAARKKTKKRPRVRPTIRDDGSVTVTVSFPMPVAVRLFEKMTENMTTPQAVTFLNEIVQTKERQKAARKNKKKGTRGKPDPGLN